MRGGRTKTVLVTIAAAALAAAGGAASADPLPRPNGVAGKGHGSTRHGVVRKGHHRPQPRTVVRCQHDDTDQLDEFDDDGEPVHIVSPGGAEPGGGNCPGAQDALGLAGILSGDHRRRAGLTGRVPARR